MNIAIRKLAMLEKALKEKEMAAAIEGISIPYCESEMHQKISSLMEQIRNY